MRSISRNSELCDFTSRVCTPVHDSGVSVHAGYYPCSHPQINCLPKLGLVPTQLTKKSIHLLSPLAVHATIFCHHLKTTHSNWPKKFVNKTIFPTQPRHLSYSVIFDYLGRCHPSLGAFCVKVCREPYNQRDARGLEERPC